MPGHDNVGKYYDAVFQSVQRWCHRHYIYKVAYFPLLKSITSRKEFKHILKTHRNVVCGCTAYLPLSETHYVWQNQIKKVLSRVAIDSDQVSIDLHPLGP